MGQMTLAEPAGASLSCHQPLVPIPGEEGVVQRRGEEPLGSRLCAEIRSSGCSSRGSERLKGLLEVTRLTPFVSFSFIYSSIFGSAGSSLRPGPSSSWGEAGPALWLWGAGFSKCWPLWLCSAGSRHPGFRSRGAWTWHLRLPGSGTQAL